MRIDLGLSPHTLIGVATVLTVLISFPTVSFATFVYRLGLPLELMSVADLTRYSFGLYIALLFAIAVARLGLMLVVFLGSMWVESDLHRRAELSRLLKAALRKEARKQRYLKRKRDSLRAWAEGLERSPVTLVVLYAAALIIFSASYGSIDIENLPIFLFFLPMMAYTAYYGIRDRGKDDYVGRVSQIPIDFKSGYFFGLRPAEIIGLIALIALVTGDMRARRLLWGNLMLVSVAGSELCGRVLFDNSDRLILVGEPLRQVVIIAKSEVRQIKSNDPSCVDEP